MDGTTTVPVYDWIEAMNRKSRDTYARCMAGVITKRTPRSSWIKHRTARNARHALNYWENMPFDLSGAWSMQRSNDRMELYSGGLWTPVIRSEQPVLYNFSIVDGFRVYLRETFNCVFFLSRGRTEERSWPIASISCSHVPGTLQNFVVERRWKGIRACRSSAPPTSQRRKKHLPRKPSI